MPGVCERTSSLHRKSAESLGGGTMTEPLFILSQEDWSLHRKGYDDQRRHREKVREAIRRHLSDLIAEESIVLSDGKQVIKLPIRTLDEYRFRFNENKGKQVGAGKGNSRVGDVLRPGGWAKGPGTPRAWTITRPRWNWNRSRRWCLRIGDCQICRKKKRCKVLQMVWPGRMSAPRASPATWISAEPC
ncbi:protein of unknown function [Kyrpidia spormannii]|uniref:DUF444 family protein n=1 Tax=Kyrpidia spormannii TaxID=2055160 RepID=A0A6F9E535_9BACL|nr:protein of unknown function [Kyrpidia spormannii]